MKLRVDHPLLQQCSISADNLALASNQHCDFLEIEIDPSVDKIIVAFRPYKIKPLIRIDGFLIDYWLAEIYQQDHQIEFQLGRDFFDRYRNRDRQGRLDSLSDQQKDVEHYLDKYIGTDNLYPDLVSQIRDLLNEKPSVRQSSQD